MEQILMYTQDILTSIFLALLSLLGAMIIYYINKAKNKLIIETNKIENENIHATTKLAIDSIDKLVKTTVYSTEQEIASEIRKKIANGDTSVSRDDLVALKDQVYDSVLESLQPELLTCANVVLGDVHKYILDKISEEVKNLKDSQNVQNASEHVQ